MGTSHPRCSISKYNMDGRAVACFVSVALIAAGVSGEVDDEMAELYQIVRENCHEETGVDLALVHQVNNGADLMPDAKLKCYIKCTMDIGGAMSDGDVDVEVLLSLLSDKLRQKIEGVLRACGSKRGADDCDTAFLTQECWQKSDKAAYFLV